MLGRRVAARDTAALRTEDGHVAPAPPGATLAVPRDVASDCSTDVTHALQSFVDGAPDHVTLSFGRGACYRIEGTLVVSGRDRIVLAGNGATLRATTRGTGDRLQVRSRAQLSITRSTDIVVRDLIVRGANPHAGANPAAYVPALEAQHAFNLLGDDSITLDAVQAYDLYGDFVYIGPAANGPSRNVTVEHSRFARSGRQGISMTGAVGVHIVDDTIDDVARSVFDLEPNLPSSGVRDVRIEHNTTGAAVNYWIANKGVGVDIGDVVVSGNVMRAPTGALVIVFGPKYGRRGPYTFVGNDLQTTAAVTDEHAAGAFLFMAVNGVTLRENRVRVPVATRLAGVELRLCTGVVLAGNVFTGATVPVHADATSRYTG